ncbi:carbohydrate ABC transporter substrate-binding protein (CUT1 family) [Paenibacillus taihuensis]|uniref:Carbohydrate ABC transporter substrate-binding protein (CUT1 family) n=1 Tax=Paenibacillus taihuensis TaxID=1156355 RepID=A0A3D9R278_9BACL|nr:extracellular solute-binding protein [Paenibacillus taihuensis]REE68788.1 carbohydrate ABC transporter substrate-binding protein (CUT1 family) [Paenibacillus taihuensis]
MDRGKASTILALGSAMLLTAMLAACDGKEDNNKKETAGLSGSLLSGETAPETAADPLGKYDPPIEITTVRNLSDIVENNVLGVLKDETFEDNRWTRLYEDKLGIKIKNNWVIKGNDTSDPYLQKMNVTLASGDLPDIIPVNATQLKQLADSNQIEDMTELYEKYASPLLKEILSEEGSGPFDAATFDGRLMAIPQTGSSIEQAQFIWIRTDWLDKLGLKAPRTMDDVLAISKAFAERDPDGNGQKDTFGLAITKDLWGSAMGLEGFMAGYGAYPNIWLEDSSGKLVYGSVQPEMKKALQALQTMYKNGELDPEFGVKEGSKISEVIANGKIGMEYGQQWNSIWPLQLNKNNDPDAQWRAFPIVSESERLAKNPLKFSTTKFFAVRKGAAYPEAVIKLFNMHVEKNWGATQENEYYYAPPDAESVWQLSMVQPAPTRKNLELFRTLDEVRKMGDKPELSGEAKAVQQKLDAYASGSKEGFALWGWERIYGPEGAEDVVDQYDKNNQFLFDKFVGAPTATMVERQSTLDKMQTEIFVKIILGAPIDDFDKFVEDWNKLGGEQMTKEVNDYYASMKK